MTHWSLLGRRILAVGEGLAPLARGALFGADVEVAGVERLSEPRPRPAELVLIDADQLDPVALLGGLANLAALAPPPPTLMVGTHLPAGLVRALMRLPHADMLEAPFSSEQLQAAIFALLDTAEAEAAPATAHSSRCWSVTGAVGGAGATTLAIEIASALADRRDKEHAVCLVDLNLSDGAAAAYLGVTGAMSVAQLGPVADRIDGALLAAFAVPVVRGLDLLACPRDPLAYEQISREAVLRILEIACEAYDHVVIDLPRHRRSWTLEILAGADEVMVVSELTVPALLAARAQAQEIEAALPGSAKPRIVLNRLAGRMFGPAPSTAEAERALERKAEAGISSDWEAAAASVNLGGAIRQHRPKSKIVRDVEALIDRLEGRQAPPAPRSLFSLPKRVA
jgi:pilus assembly protein CpaE